ncbi:MAG: 2-C-methyl-D-erythritol 4-phosphate cytidylyltransferase [Thermodesulfobacteriota bacterium]
MDKKAPNPKTSDKTLALVPAAGAGVRMGTGRAKQFLDLCGSPVLAVTLRRFQLSPLIHEIVAVVPPGEVEYCREEIVRRFGLDKVKRVVEGGKRRQDSVRLGLEASGSGYDLVVIHDGVRPLLRAETLERVLKAARKDRAVIAALPARDTIKEVDADLRVTRTYPRGQVWLVQTPQVFRYEDILAAHREAFREDWDEMTDDALLVERIGIPVKVVEGAEDNIKVTSPQDLELARFLLARQQELQNAELGTRNGEGGIGNAECGVQHTQ